MKLKVEVIETNPISLKGEIGTWIILNSRAHIFKTNLTALNEHLVIYTILYYDENKD